MTVDPGTLAAVRDEYHPNVWDRSNLIAAMQNEIAALRTERDPLYAVWSETKPPCPTCDPAKCSGRTDCMARVHVHGCFADSCQNDQHPCPDCPDGVQPFNNWVAGLATLWTAVHGDWSWSNVLVGPSGASAINGCRDHLRQIGGTS